MLAELRGAGSGVLFFQPRPSKCSPASPLKLLRIYFVFDLSLPGGDAIHLAGFTRCLRVTHAIESGLQIMFGARRKWLRFRKTGRLLTRR
jgi:hypothetical protein